MTMKRLKLFGLYMLQAVLWVLYLFSWALQIGSGIGMALPAKKKEDD
jgi:hypothetical protein